MRKKCIIPDLRISYITDINENILALKKRCLLADVIDINDSFPSLTLMCGMFPGDFMVVRLFIIYNGIIFHICTVLI
jgi:hypothetical protein